MRKSMGAVGLVWWSLACGGAMVADVQEPEPSETLKPAPVEVPTNAWKPTTAEEALPLLVGTWVHFVDGRSEVFLTIQPDGSYQLDDGMCDSSGVTGKLEIYRVTPSWINADVPLEKDILSFSIGVPLRPDQGVDVMADCIKDRGEQEPKLSFSKVEE